MSAFSKLEAKRVAFSLSITSVFDDNSLILIYRNLQDSLRFSSLSLCLSLSVYLCLSVCMSLYLSLSLSLFIYLSLFLFLCCLCLSFSLYLSFSLFLSKMWTEAVWRVASYHYKIFHPWVQWLNSNTFTHHDCCI
uniref:Uncharacterized protein n=1 Tax=Cacopsylla melanoneura TaxID=428564 RepID=A0A8D8VRG4_9HEMI